MITILSQQSLEICFDQLTGCVRGHWESGPITRDNEYRESRILGCRTPVKTAIHGHIYYLHLLPELIDYCQRVPNRKLLFNTDTSAKAKAIEATLQKRGEDNAIVKVMPNRGRDLAPLLIGWKNEIEDCKLLIHCHTKKTPHARQDLGSAWRESMLEACFPKNNICLQFQQLLSEENGGLINPWPHHFIAHNANWGGNFRQVQLLMQSMGFDISRDTMLHFPAGSFFWANVNALIPLFSLQLRWDDFSPEPIPGDGKLVHAIERCLGLVPMLNNRTSYSSWAGRLAHGMSSGPSNHFLQALPRHCDVKDLCPTWFAMGFSQAIANIRPIEQSIPLGRISVPSTLRPKNIFPMNNKVQFLICGAQKSGTTALASYLRKHPELQIPEQKELHFFDDESQDWKRPTYNEYHIHFEASNKKEIWGEATPIYMYWEKSVERIWKYNPDMHLIVILRNPIERAYSHWAMEKKRLAEPLNFEEALEQENQRAQSALPFQDRIHSYVDRGRYSNQIRRLWRFFGKESVTIIRQEELLENPIPTIQKVCTNLNIKSMQNVDTIEANRGKYSNPMSERAREWLIQELRGEIIDLGMMLNWNCENWLTRSAKE